MGGQLSTYVILLSYTDAGMRNAAYLSGHPRALRQLIEEAGGRLPYIWMTMGPYDFAAIMEANSDEDCAAIVLSLSSLGNFRTVTMRAFGEGDLPAIAEKIPSLEDQFENILRTVPGSGSGASVEV